jgi:hypothetical protein
MTYRRDRRFCRKAEAAGMAAATSRIGCCGYHPENLADAVKLIVIGAWRSFLCEYPFE